MNSVFEEDMYKTLTLDPPLKRYWGLLAGLLVALLVSYALWGQPLGDQSDNQQNGLESMRSQPAISTSPEQAKAVPNIGLAMSQDWWQSPAAQAEANKRLINHLYSEVLNSGTFDLAEHLFATDFTYREPGVSTDLITYWQQIEARRAAYYGLRYRIEDMISEGDQVVVRWLASGTSPKTFETHPPTGQPDVWRGVTIWQVTGGKIAAGWTVFNGDETIR